VDIRLDGHTESAGDIAGMRELTALESRPLDRDRLAAESGIDELGEDAVGPHARTVGRPEAKGDGRHPAETVTGQGEQFTGDDLVACLQQSFGDVTA
jgi:hypothetical protein